MQHGLREKHLPVGFRNGFCRQRAGFLRRVRRDLRILNQSYARLLLYQRVLHYLPMDYARSPLDCFDFPRNFQVAGKIRGLPTFRDRKHLVIESHNRASSQGFHMLNLPLDCKQSANREGKEGARGQ